MIFPALYRFAKARGLLDDTDFTEQTLHARIDIGADGHLLGVFSVGEKVAPVKRIVSRIPPRNSAAIAVLGADTADRIVPDLNPEANKFAVQTQTLFLEQLRALQVVIQRPALAAIIAFLEHLHADPQERSRIKTVFEELKLRPDAWLTFTVEGGDYLVDWPELKTWWREQCAATRAAKAKDSRDDLIPCMVTGQLCHPERTHGTRIKVAPGGLPGGVALVSNDKGAFSSYGFDKALSCPMSEDAVEAYVRAINWLGDKAHASYHYRTSDTIYLFWCGNADTTENPGKALTEGDPAILDIHAGIDADDDDAPIVNDSPGAAVAIHNAPAYANLSAIASGADQTAEHFYSLAISGSAARGIIRAWIDQPLPEILRNVRHWFEDITIPLDRDLLDPTDKTKDLRKRRRLAHAGETWNRWPLWRLVSALQGKGDINEKELARLRNQLWQCALLGRHHPAPLELIIIATRRIASTGDCPPHRAALIRALLYRLHQQKPENAHTTMSDIEHKLSQSEAFLCGRLLRILESAQYYALGDVNATVVDKFYAAASTTPAIVFGHLMGKLQTHLSKGKKSPAPKTIKPPRTAEDVKGTVRNLEYRVAEISAALSSGRGFPKIFTPEEQGAFALGFYSERLRRRKEDPVADQEIEDATDSPDTDTAKD